MVSREAFHIAIISLWVSQWLQSSCCASCADVGSIGISLMTQGSPLSQRSMCVCPMHICSFTYSNEACTLHQQFVFSSLQCKCQFAIAILSVHCWLLNCINFFLCSENVIWHNAAVLPQSPKLRYLFIVQGVLLETHHDAENSIHTLSSEQCSQQWRTSSMLKRISSWVLEPHTCSADCKALLF